MLKINLQMVQTASRNIGKFRSFHMSESEQLMIKKKDEDMLLPSRLNVKFADKLKLNKTVEVIQKSFAIFQPNELLLSFNGGKDCTVLADLLYKCREECQTEFIKGLYIRNGEPFDEVEEFIEKTSMRYKMPIQRYVGTYKSALEAAVNDMPQIGGIFLGCRRTDPNVKHEKNMVPTDHDWPLVLRIFPLLDWTYHDVWHYIIQNKVPYCQLYDQGYSSLGDKSNTSVNPNLKVFDKASNVYKFRPAYELDDIGTERKSRKPNSKT